MKFKIPLRNNKKLQILMNRINADQELFQIWKCAFVPLANGAIGVENAAWAKRNW